LTGCNKFIGLLKDECLAKPEGQGNRADRYNLLRFDHFWLSDKPHTPGLLGWDAACPRMVTWVCLQDKRNGDTLFVFNTHLDHVGIQAREMGAVRISHSGILCTFDPGKQPLPA